MTRLDLINLIAETETRMGFGPTKGLRRMVKAELENLWADTMFAVESDAHMDNDYITQVDATLAAQTAFPVHTLVSADFAPGVWEVQSTFQVDRLLAPVDSEAKAYAASLPNQRITRTVDSLWTSEAQYLTDAVAQMSPADTTPADLFDRAWVARDLGQFWVAWAMDNRAEDLGGHADRRATCYACGTWANHEHDKVTGAKVYTWPQIDTDNSGVHSRVYRPQTVTV